MAQSIHSGHRERMRQRYLVNGFSGYQPHEVLEMLLFYGIPRRDTNETAHKLLQKFGSLHNILCADPATLQQAGIPQNAAVLLSMFREVQRYTACERLNGSVLDSCSKVCEYFCEIYHYEENECVYAAVLDEQLHVLKCEIIAEGHPRAAAFLARPIIEMAMRCGAGIAVLAHNHPAGTLHVSPEDIAVTRHLVDTLRDSCITLVDHVLVAEQKAVSMRKAGVFLGLEIV